MGAFPDMYRILLALILLILTMGGCATTEAVDQAVEEAVEVGGDAADTILDKGREAFCSERFSRRAYRSFAERHGKTEADLCAWCNWQDGWCPGGR